MSDKLPVISGKQLIHLLEQLGFVVIRVRGSHHRVRHPDGRVTTVPVHKNDPIAKGLLRKIIREDILIGVEEFNKLVR
jgi:predicted RNA binding protein YcfA (HicA-like mRNA interferase family)